MDLIGRVRVICAEVSGRDTTVAISPEQYEGSCESEAEFLEAIDQHEWQRAERVTAWVRTGSFRDVNAYIVFGRTSLDLSFDNGSQHERTAIKHAVEDVLPRFERDAAEVSGRLRRESRARFAVPLLAVVCIVVLAGAVLGFEAQNVLVGYGVAAPFWVVAMALMSKRERAVRAALPPAEFLPDDGTTSIMRLDRSSRGRLGALATWSTVLGLPVAVIAIVVSVL